MTAQSIVLDGDLTIGDRTFAVREMVNQYSAVEGDGAAAASGRRYSKYGLGMALVEVPFYAAGHLLARVLSAVPKDYITLFTTSMTNVVVCAMWCLLFFEFTRCFQYQPATRIWLTGIFGAGSLVLPYAGYGFSEPLVGLALSGAVWGIHRYRQRRSWQMLFLSGALAGLAAATKPYSLVALPFLFIYVWPELKRSTRRRRDWAGLLVPLGLFVLLIAWHNWVRYGNVFKTGYHLDELARHGGYFSFSLWQIATASYGLLLSTGRGLLLFLPVAILAPVALRRFRVSFFEEARLFGGLIGAHFALYIFFKDWHGGSCWGPRYLLPIFPFLILPLGSLIENANGWARSVKLLGLLGFLVQLPAAVINPHLFVRFVQDKHIGDLVFFPGQPGDLLFSPSLSPVLAGYCQLASAVSRWLTGASLAYPVPSGTQPGLASLASYDLLDVWWANAIRAGLLSPVAAAGILAVTAVLLASTALSAWKLYRWSVQPVDA